MYVTHMAVSRLCPHLVSGEILDFEGLPFCSARINRGFEGLVLPRRANSQQGFNLSDPGVEEELRKFSMFCYAHYIANDIDVLGAGLSRLWQLRPGLASLGLCGQTLDPAANTSS